MTRKIRYKRIEIRCTDAERDTWKHKAATAGISVANLIRRCLNSAEVAAAPAAKTPRVYSKADPELIRHVSRIGNNLNQIARGINANGVENAAQLHADLIAIYRRLERVKEDAR
jgi:hypothetical protein